MQIEVRSRVEAARFAVEGIVTGRSRRLREKWIAAVGDDKAMTR